MMDATAKYTKSLRDQIDGLKATRAHDKLKIDGLESRLARYREALEKIATQELDFGDLEGMGEEVALADAVQIARTALKEGEEE